MVEGGEGMGKGAYPDVEVEVLVRDGFDVEADCRDGGDDFADLCLLDSVITASIFRLVSSCREVGVRRGGIP